MKKTRPIYLKFYYLNRIDSENRLRLVYSRIFSEASISLKKCLGGTDKDMLTSKVNKSILK